MIESIRIFIKVTDLGSFSKAAAVLNMAPSSISRHIDKLEKHMEISIFKRSTRQLVLTEDGLRFLNGASRLVDAADELKDSFRPLAKEPEGILSISCFESFGQLHLCAWLPEFLSKYPKLNVDVQLEPRMVDLNTEDIDIAIRIGKPLDSGLMYKHLLSNQTVICASLAYFAQKGIPETPEDLTGHNCLLLQQARQKRYWYFQQGLSSKRIEVRGNLSSKGGTALLQGALMGVGLGQLPYWMVAKAIEEAKLSVCLNDWQSSIYPQSNGEVYAVYNNKRFIKPGLRVFLDFLLEKSQALHPQ